MAQIEPLPPNVVNKIAAGEVVERPASVVKEIMENSIDAGAKRIDVSLEKGGAVQIRVVDDGSGIAADQLILAVTSHATSKIRSDSDLFRVDTLGFRGEALASIASVSHMHIRSRLTESDSGAALEIRGGTIDAPVPCGCPVGTSIDVDDLFFNTPVRRRFLRTTQTELSHSTEAFTRLALAHPGIHFTLTSNGRQIYDFAPVESWRQRIAVLFGTELADDLIAVESVDDATRLSGYVANPSHSRGNNRMQYLFLNGRFIRDRSLQHALSEGYRGLLLTGRYPICFLRLDLPAELVDVNVHPTKLEVKFQDGGRIYSQLLGTLRTRFLNSDLTARLAPKTNEAANGRPDLPPALTAGLPAASSTPFASRGPSPESPVETTLPVGPQPAGARLPLSNPASEPVGGGVDFPPVSTAESDAAPQATAVSSRAPAAMQVLNRYLVAETQDGIVVIDQHALHERILYEQLREKVMASAMETQTLLVPEPIDMAPDEAAAVLESSDLLEQLGVQVEPFGGGTVLISSYPAMLANWSPTSLVRALAEKLTEGGKAPDRRDLLDELLHMISCKAAIKAGDRLAPDEITALLDQRDLAQDAHHCPHGRPTALVFSRDELDRQFKRT